MLLWATAYFSALLFHEVGHLLVACLAGIRVERFFIGLDAGNFALLRFRRGATTWGIGWLPLGSYVKLAGIDEPAIACPRRHDLRSRSRYVQALVVLAGPAVNIVAGLLFLQLAGAWSQPFWVMQLWLAAWSLVPLPGHDGHRLLALAKPVLFSPYPPGPSSHHDEHDHIE